MRADLLRTAADNPEGVLNAYENFKESYVASGETEPTAALCLRQNLKVIPMVIEAHAGGWSKKAKRVLDTIAKQISATWNEDAAAASLLIAQRLSITLHKENSRAILRRLQEAPADQSPDLISPDWFASLA